MTLQNAPSIFESFNARALAPQQVAQTFIPPPQYDRLTNRAHSLIIGPRGSGKTTLLKMLQPAALSAWTHPGATRYRAKIDFTGVFVATDVSWGAQLDSLGYGTFDDQTRKLFSVAAFTTHILRAVVMAMESRVWRTTSITSEEVMYRQVQLTKEQEVALTRDLSQAWYLTPSLPTLAGLRFSLSARLSQIRELASREALLGLDGRAERLAALQLLHLHFIPAASLAVEMFDHFTASDGGKWTLLFDELELAPRWIRDELVSALRSVDDRFLFKLSLSPFTKELDQLRSALSAMPGHDYDAIVLWYAHKEEGYEFSESLFQAMLKERGLPAAEPEQLLGRSDIDTGRDEWADFGTAYRPGSRASRRFTRLAANDASFAQYLERKHINVRRLDRVTGPDRASDVRKIAPLVAVRDAFRVPDQQRASGVQQQVRSRKVADIYAGVSSVFAMVEGNPRWFIGVMGRLLAEIDEAPESVRPARQVREVMDAAHRFRALLKTIPCSPQPGSGRGMRGVLDLLDRVGAFIHRQVVVDDFSADPAGSFIVDSHISDSILEALGQALNSGAIVYVADGTGELLLTSLRGKRFRLCYLL
jgi:hypothetical protein